MSNFRTKHLEAQETSLVEAKSPITGTNVTQDDDLIKRGLDTNILNELTINPDNKSQQQINAALQVMNATLLRIEFLLKSIGE